MRRAAVLISCLAVAWSAVAAVPAIAAPKAAKKQNLAGRLDPSFGKGGKVTVGFPAEGGGVGAKYELPFQFSAGHLEMAAAPGGKIVVAGATKIVRLLANGKPDPSFGPGGSISVARPAGMNFVLAGVAVDSRGRVLLGGSAIPQPTSSTPDPLLGSAMVMRFEANGSVDRSFGSEGTLISALGIEPPLIGATRYPGAAVGLEGLAVDSQDRPLLSGGSVSSVVDCYGTETAISTAFVGRLTEAGALDPSFGEGGLRRVSGFASLAQGRPTPSGTILGVASANPSCPGSPRSPAVVLTGLGAEGSLDPGFGFAGFRAVGFPHAPVVAVAPSGKIVLLGSRQGKLQLVMRLLPNGAADPSFRRIGRVNLVLPKGEAAFAAVAVDGRGRPVFAGRISKAVSNRDGSPRSSFWLARMKPKGTIDRSFGRHGTVRTGFGGPSNSFATQVAIDARGRILVGGGISTRLLGTGGGYAIARYVNGR
jgi:uncharacterized delta-60 repeat protein